MNNLDIRNWTITNNQYFSYSFTRFHNLDGEAERKRTEQSFFVPKDEIKNNDYDLSINKYKETEYIPIEYPPTEEILAEIEKINKQVEKETAELRKLLGL